MKLAFTAILSTALLLYQEAESQNRFQELADELYAAGNVEKAFRTYGDAIRSDRPEDFNYKLYMNAGDCAYLLNYKQIALNYYCISTQKGAPAHLLIKHIRETYCNGDIDCTGETVKQIIGKVPTASDSLSNAIGELLFNKTRFKEAIPILKGIEEREPNNIRIKNMLASAMLNNNDGDSAKVLYQEILDLDPDNFDASLFLGNYYYLVAKESELRLDENSSEETRSTVASFYDKASLYLEKVYASKQSDIVKEKLIDIYSATKQKEKLSLYK